MQLSKQPYKGARDFYPEDKRIQKYMFGKIRQVVESYGYQEYDAPIIEPLEIYLAKTGQEIINDQIYSFTDRGDRQVAIRPEMTPTVSRMVAAKRQELSYPLRWYSIPNLWRYERPQRGRLREHWQLNVDIFGVSDVEADHEAICVANSILRSFGAPSDSYLIRLSSRKLTMHFLHDHLKLNPTDSIAAQKLIDKKHKMPRDEFVKEAQEILSDNNHVAQFMEYLQCENINALPSSVSGHESVKDLQKLFELLSASGVTEAVFDTSIVRGMDYYTDIVFEVFDSNPENMRSMFGGGRYDGLVGLFGVEPVPTVGFGMGDVTLQNFLETHKLLPKLAPETNLTAIIIGNTYLQAQKAVAELRAAGVNVAIDSSGRKIDTQIKNAVKSGVKYALFIGEEEVAKNVYKLRDLEKGEAQDLTLAEIISKLSVHKTA